jgi:hypothetical protein
MPRWARTWLLAQLALLGAMVLGLAGWLAFMLWQLSRL